MHTIILHDFHTNINGTEVVVCVDEQQEHGEEQHANSCNSQLHDAYYMFSGKSQMHSTVLLILVCPFKIFDFTASVYKLPKQKFFYIIPKKLVQFFIAVPFRAPPAI